MVKDLRDATNWITLELSRLGETKLIEGTLLASLRRDLGVDENFQIFVPAATFVKNGRPVTIHLMQGYVFIAAGLEEACYFILEHKPYVVQVLAQRSPSGLRVLNVISDANIQELRLQLRTLLAAGVEVGARVQILEGLYENLEGEVLTVEQEKADVLIELRSLVTIAHLPKLFLDLLPEEPLTPVKAPEEPPVPQADSPASVFDVDTLLTTKALPSKRPTASFFYNAVLVTLGRKSEFKPFVGIPFREVQEEVLREVGIDPENCPWELKGRQGLYRRVHYAFRNQREGYIGQTREVYTVQIQKGFWALSEKGAQVATELHRQKWASK